MESSTQRAQVGFYSSHRACPGPTVQPPTTQTSMGLFWLGLSHCPCFFYSPRSMVSLSVMKQPCLGHNVNPNKLTVRGTSSLHGIAALTTLQQQWHCALKTLHPSLSHLSPMHPRGKRYGAPGLQHISALQQHTPALKQNEKNNNLHQ